MIVRRTYQTAITAKLVTLFNLYKVTRIPSSFVIIFSYFIVLMNIMEKLNIGE